MNKSENYVQRHFDKVHGSSVLTALEKQRIAETVQLIPDSVRTILDAGCGDCRLSNLIQANGQYAITSLDFSMRGLENARSRAVKC